MPKQELTVAQSIRAILAAILVMLYWITICVCVYRSWQFEPPADHTLGFTIFMLVFLKQDLFDFIEWFIGVK